MRRILFVLAIMVGAMTVIAQAEAVDRTSGLTSGAKAKATAKSRSTKRVRKTKSGSFAKRRAAMLPTVKAVKPAGLPFSLVDAVISKESRYNAKAVGSKGEIGLMQIMPSTARGLARSLGYKKMARMSTSQLRTHLNKPRNNLKLGLAYLSKCHKLAKGNIGATIGCYNAGPGNMWRWHKIKITRNYVKYVRSKMR